MPFDSFIVGIVSIELVKDVIASAFRVFIGEPSSTTIADVLWIHGCAWVVGLRAWWRTVSLLFPIRRLSFHPRSVLRGGTVALLRGFRVPVSLSHW